MANAFELSGRLAGRLSPGLTQPLELTISNPFKFALRLTKLIEDRPGEDECIEQAEATREPGGALNPAG